MTQLDPQRDASSAGGDWFATTHWSVVLAAGRTSGPEAQAALERLCRTYWYPLYAHVRRRGHSPPDAQDLTQEFFARLLAKGFLDRVAADKGKFRSFLLAAMNHFLANEWDRMKAEKRGGGKVLISLDERTAEQTYLLEPASDPAPELSFDKRWAATLLEQAFASLREEYVGAKKERIFECLKTFLAAEAGSGDYVIAGESLGMSTNAVAVAVHRLRERYRELVRAEIANTVASPDEIDEEMRYLFKVLVS